LKTAGNETPQMEMEKIPQLIRLYRK